MKKLFFFLLLTIMTGCSTHHSIESNSTVDLKPIEIKPIHIIIDINIKVDKALDDFFGDLDKAQ
jgi:uncharacterized protein YcfL